jgi:hypothetical protein
MGSVDIKQDWWFDEIIMLQSIWRRVGKQIYLTLLTDPIDIKNKIVWCVSISTEVLTNKNFNGLKQITLNDIKRTDLEEFVKQINEIVLG